MRTLISGVFCFLFMKMTSQVCGGSLYKLNVYTLNGVEKKTFYYEFLPAPGKYIEIAESTQGYRGNGLMTFFDSDIIKSIDYGDTLSENFSELLISRKISRKGIISPSLKILTHELFYQPVLLKISDGVKEYFILGNFFGGCKDDLSIVWKVDFGVQVF